ncbi:hypothetical protein BS47DRAFT_1351209 [Hydnum rufescens UP504]|uniref:OPT family small oligopeptide transporter n=1 Tax=Hydnum rufescens UP504 TaxID=1448309 RepID=A0A9P6AMW3_9AGAM|nr:hypothetical protein BS47DRAFT_1351209 [Hydnum rufescens UP504]
MTIESFRPDDEHIEMASNSWGTQADEEDENNIYTYEEDQEDARTILLREAGTKRPRLKVLEDDPLDDSPASMVHRSVPETDDPTLPTLTFRVVLLGSLMCVLNSAISQLFYFKSNAPSFSAYFVILVTHPAGKWLAKILPDRIINVHKWTFSLNPGAWSIKEHLLVVVFAQSGGSAYAADIITIQRLYYKQNIGVLSGITLLLTTQLIGFGLSGFLQPILVRPLSMVFPRNLVYVTLFSSLNLKGKETRDRLKIFKIAFVACFIYQTFPTVLFPTLNSLALLCLINNDNFVLRTLGSGFQGFGILNFSFDWNSIGSVGPFFTPWWAQLNFFAGLIGMMFVITPIAYFSNIWNAKSFPSPISTGLFNSSYQRFDVLSILNDDFTLNEEAWQLAQPLLLTPSFAYAYALGFAALTSAVVHVLLWHFEDIKNAISTASKGDYDDNIHNQLMRVYPTVPAWWYFSLFGVTLLAAVILIETAPLQLPAWALLLAIFVAMAFLVPVGIIRAVSETQIGLNIITELVAGFLIPGKPIANVVFKCYGYMAMSQALDLTADLKLSVYMKVPPRHMFITQISGAALGCVVNYFTLNSVISAKQDFLDGTVEDPTGQWTGRSPSTFYSASVIWGLVGPARFFVGKYSILYLGFLAGAVLPVIPWLLHKRCPKLGLDKISIPIIVYAAALPPLIPTNIIITGFATAYFSQVYLRRHHGAFFEKYNYVLSAALDAGTSVNALVIYIALTIVLGGWEAPHWWLNSAQDVEHCKPGS